MRISLLSWTDAEFADLLRIGAGVWPPQNIRDAQPGDVCFHTSGSARLGEKITREEYVEMVRASGVKPAWMEPPEGSTFFRIAKADDDPPTGRAA